MPGSGSGDSFLGSGSGEEISGSGSALLSSCDFMQTKSADSRSNSHPLSQLLWHKKNNTIVNQLESILKEENKCTNCISCVCMAHESITLVYESVSVGTK